MIVKIWPIKVDYAGDKSKVGGIEGLKNTFDYITDADKVVVRRDDVSEMNILDDASEKQTPDDYDIDDRSRVLNYMANEEKIEGKYISGYLCDPDNAVSDFNTARESVLFSLGRDWRKETGAVAFHLVQSFPEGLSISDEEVHQCGLELCEKINAHQAVICSHVHPTIDEKGEVHGKSKHNHILLNAYIHPNKLNPNQPDVAKYNDCKETYAQLRAWNDEIAIEHGLPIIRNPDDDRIYSWKETSEINKGTSWKQRIRLDVEDARRASSNFSEFVVCMNEKGYEVKDGKNITYKSPDKHTARGNKLGRQYTKQSLELYWKMRDLMLQDVNQSVQDNSSPPLLDTILAVQTPLRAAIPIGMKSQDPQQYYYLPLENVSQTKEVVATYFNEDDRYDICDENGAPVDSATGREIMDCIERLRKGKDRLLEQEDEERQREAKEEEKRKKERYYYSLIFINSKTKKPYRTSLYDKNGRRRNTLELLFLMAAIVVKKEDGLWNTGDIPPGKADEPYYAPTNWKIQNMIDSIYLAEEEGIESLAQLDARLNETGAAYSRARSALKKTKNAKEKMEPLRAAVAEYRKTSEIAQEVLDMPEGPEREQAEIKYKAVLDRYKAAKATLYRYQVTEEEAIVDFERRYVRVQNDIEELEERFDLTKEEYRKLKKLKYNTELAQNTQYCYGPDYSYDVQYQHGEEIEINPFESQNSGQDLDELMQKGSEMAGLEDRGTQKNQENLF